MNLDPHQQLLRIRPSLPDKDDVTAERGPLMMEAVLSSLHSLIGRDAEIGLEIGYTAGKIAFFTRSTKRAAALVESQIYAQYPDAEIEMEITDPFAVADGEVVVSADLTLTEPDVFPIKRHPQFIDLASRKNIDSIAGITSALVRYSQPGMRAHIQIAFTPVAKKFRKRALKFLPLLTRGIAKHSVPYAKLFTRAHLASGLERLLFFPLDMLMGGFRAWFLAPPNMKSISLFTGEVDKVNRLLFRVNVRISVITPKAHARDAVTKIEEIAGSFRQFTLPQSNGFVERETTITSGVPFGFRMHPVLLSVEELATLWHVPNILVKTPNLDMVTSKKLEPPVDLRSEE